MGWLHGEKIEISNRFTKGNSNKITVKAAVCPKCGNISFTQMILKIYKKYLSKPKLIVGFNIAFLIDKYAIFFCNLRRLVISSEIWYLNIE